MKIVLLQRDICWADPVRNRERADEALARSGKADLYVLPEMFPTGFCVQPEEVAECSDGKTLEWMRKKAAELDSALAGSVAVTENGAFYNRFYFVLPDGTARWYDKRHLFTYGGEHRRYAAGTERVVVTFRGVRILLQICYDLRFPVWARNRGDYDMILYVASWPTPRVEAWNLLLRARAIENQCYVAGVNRVGADPACEYCGGTALIDPYGKTVAECETGRECEACGNVDMELLETFRKKFPVLDDADAFDLCR